jgi:hypothetical protein
LSDYAPPRVSNASKFAEMWKESMRVELADPVIAADGCKNLLAKISGKKLKFCPNIKGLFRKRNMEVRILQGRPGSRIPVFLS